MLRLPLDELLREVKTDPNVVHSTDSKSATLLHFAAREGRVDVIESLIDNGAGKLVVGFDVEAPGLWNKTDDWLLRSILLFTAHHIDFADHYIWEENI